MAHGRRKRGRRIRRPRTLKQYLALRRRSADAAQNAAQVVTRMRDGISLTSAAREYGIDPRTVLRYAGPALRRRKNGRYAPKSRDNLPRRLVVPVHGGHTEIIVRGFEAASQIGKRSAAQREFLASGDDTEIRRLVKIRVKDAAGHDVPFLTDLDELERLGEVGLLEFESIYARHA